MKPSFSPAYSAPSEALRSPVAAAMTPHISAEQAARGLGNKLPYGGGAMALHQSGAGKMRSPGAFPAADGQQSHVIHNPRFV